jgi:hypothetical protein
MNLRKYAIVIITIAISCFVSSCINDTLFDEVKQAGFNNTLFLDELLSTTPLLNDLEISSASSTSITLAHPTFSNSGDPLPTVKAYIGYDGSISISGTVVSNSLQGPVSVSGAGCTFSSLTKGVTYRIIVVAQNSHGVSVKQIPQKTPDLRGSEAVMERSRPGR